MYGRKREGRLYKWSFGLVLAIFRFCFCGCTASVGWGDVFTPDLCRIPSVVAFLFIIFFLLLSVTLISSKSSIQAFPRLTCQSRIHRSPHSFLVIWDQVILGRRYGGVGLRTGSSHRLCKARAVAAACKVHITTFLHMGPCCPHVCDPLPALSETCQLNKFSYIHCSFFPVFVKYCRCMWVWVMSVGCFVVQKSLLVFTGRRTIGGH